MRFARIVFLLAGVWGIVVLTPLYFGVDITGRPYPPPSDYPQFFYGFLWVTMVWQLIFLLIGSNPHRFRPLMILAILEKLGFVITVGVLHGQEKITTDAAMVAVPDLLLGVLFIAAFVKTRAAYSFGAT